METEQRCKVKVIFRKWKNGDIIALFPEVPSNYAGDYCESYEHVGQHGGANCLGVIMETTLATDAEAADLAAELNRIGYELTICKRATRAMYEARRNAAYQL